MKATKEQKEAFSDYYRGNRESLLEKAKLNHIKNKFNRNAYSKDYYQNNKEKLKQQSRQRAIANPNRVKASNLKKFGITLDQYNEMLSKQNGLCAICKKNENHIDNRSGKKKDLFVDHNHKTGKVRGLLCGKCNSGLGYFRDNSEIISNAINYLKNNEEA